MHGYIIETSTGYESQPPRFTLYYEDKGSHMEPATHFSIFVALKNISYVVAFIATLEFLNLDGMAVSMLAILLLLDFFTGVLRAGVVDGVHTIRSSEGIRGAASKAIVFVIPFVLAIAGKGVGMDLAALASSSISIFICSTTYSIIGNVHSVTTGKPKVEFDAIDYMYRQVGNTLKKIIREDV